MSSVNVQFSVSMDLALVNKMQAIITARGISKAEFVRDIITNLIKDADPTAVVEATVKEVA